MTSEVTVTRFRAALCVDYIGSQVGEGAARSERETFHAQQF